MTTQEFRIVTVSGEVHRVTVVWSDAPTLVAMAEALRRGLLVREIVPPGEMTRDEAVVAERSRCAALAQSVADAIDTDAARETASAIVDEMLRDRSRSVETPAQAYGLGRLAGLAEGARIVRAEAERLREPRDDTQTEAIGRNISAGSLRKAAWLIDAATNPPDATAAAPGCPVEAPGGVGTGDSASGSAWAPGRPLRGAEVDHG